MPRREAEQRSFAPALEGQPALFSLTQGDAAGNYDEYFGTATDIEAVVYMMIMNQMLHDLYPNIVTVGEDVSGMPTFSRWDGCPGTT